MAFLNSVLLLASDFAVDCFDPLPCGLSLCCSREGKEKWDFCTHTGSICVCVSDVGAIIHFFPNIFYLMLYKRNIILQHLTTINSELDYFLYLFFLHLEQHAPIWTSHIYGEEETPWD